MSTYNTRKTAGMFGIALAGLVLSGTSFAMQPLAQGYMVAASHASAEGKCGEGKCGDARFAQTDSDDDGRVSRAEFDAVVPNGAAYFAKIDKSGDGYIDEKEAYDNVRGAFEAHGKKVPAGLFANFK